MFQLLAENQLVRMTALLALFVIVALGSYAFANGLGVRQATKRRLSGAAGTQPDEAQLVSSLRTSNTQTTWHKIIDAIEKSGLSLVDSKDDALRQKLNAAGFTATYAPRAYTLIRLVLVIGLPVLALLLTWSSGARPSILRLYFTLVVAAAAGLYIPSLLVRVRSERRQREIINAFPDALDLMLVCVEAGLGLEAAFDRVGQEMIRSHPLLAQQFGAVVLELRAGRSREDALRRMADRAGAEEVRAFATLLIQSTKLGSSIATTLRIYAAEMREKRRMRAEEKAHRLPVLLSIPLVGCMLPVMIGVLMLPAVIRVVRTLLPAMAGGS